MVIRAAARTDVGHVREKNEDYFYVDSVKGLFIVCDGLGGHMAGDVASAKAIEFAVDYIESQWNWIHSPGSPLDSRDECVLKQFVENTIQYTCDCLIKHCKTSPQFDGMATTMTLLLIVDGLAVVGHVGDSRLYLKQASQARQLTRDHTLFAEFVSENPNWTYDRVDFHAIQRFRRVLTRCLGRDEQVVVETLSFEPGDGDVLLLCTDGLSNYFESERKIAGMLEGDDVDEIADRLIRFAIDSGGRDNVTAIVVRITDVKDFVLRQRRVEFDSDDTIDFDQFN